MNYQVKHACGHQQNHYVAGYASQRERKLRWLESTSCRPCFIAGKQAEQAAAGAKAEQAIAHLGLTPLIGSERQVAWATTIRATRLAAIAPAVAGRQAEPSGSAWYRVGEAKWWIDHRDRPDDELAAIGTQLCAVSN